MRWALRLFGSEGQRIDVGPREVMTKVETYEQLKLTRTFWRLVRE